MQYIGIINLEMSNLGSIKNVILHLGKKAELINDFSNLNKFTHLIYPGIGSFAEASKIIKKKKLKKLINFLEKGSKLFGICLEMQLMFESSEEHGKSSGLGLFKGKVIKFGIGRTTYDASQEIRNNHITRDGAKVLAHRFEGEFPDKYFSEVIEYLKIKEKTFFKWCDDFRSPHLWIKKKRKWKLRHNVNKTGEDD